jgi:Carboxypeptidase regulatory-like domain
VQTAKGCAMRTVSDSKLNYRRISVQDRVRLAARLAAGSLLAVALVCACWRGAYAQISTGSISGTIADAQGGAIAGATVKAILVSTDQVFTTTSDSVGSFRLNALPIGTYQVEASKDGFKQISVPSIEVAVAVDRGLGTLKLDVGDQTTTVEVKSSAPLVEQSEAQVTNTFSGAVLSNFSGIQENEGLDSLALFVPGVVSSRDIGFSNSNGGLGFSSNGLRGRNNDQEIDGQNNNDNDIGGPSLFLSDTEFVQQYDVITNNFGAEYGRNAGSVVNIATKSGTNDWHGSVYGNENNSVLNSLTSTAIASGTTKPPRANEEFSGATVGGPIVRNKMFLFAGFDTDIVSTSTVYNSANVTPTPAGLATLAACFGSGPSAATVSALTRFGPFGESIGNPVATPTGPNNTFLSENLGGCNSVQVGGSDAHSFKPEPCLQLGNAMGRSAHIEGHTFCPLLIQQIDHYQQRGRQSGGRLLREHTRVEPGHSAQRNAQL